MDAATDEPPSETDGFKVEDLRRELAAISLERDELRDELERLHGGFQGTVLAKLTYLGDRIGKIDRKLNQIGPELLYEAQALAQLFQRFEPKATLPLVAGWALNPSGILALVDLINESRTGTIVECGSGTSTLWMAYAVKAKGRGKVVSLEHLEEYADETRALLAIHGLTNYAEVLHAPLTSHSFGEETYAWYGLDDVELAPASVDILVVDGPPGDTGRHARYPALPVLKPYLADHASILADDTNRKDEREVLGMWISEDSSLRVGRSPGRSLQIISLDRLST